MAAKIQSPQLKLTELWKSYPPETAKNQPLGIIFKAEYQCIIEIHPKSSNFRQQQGVTHLTTHFT
jgi:hypothetical protein